MKISKWNEISYETFKDVFYRFVEREDWTKDLVLEVQDPLSISKGDHYDRMYLGTCIEVTGWDKFCSQPYIDILQSVAERNGETLEEAVKNPERKCVVLVMLQRKNPTVVPLLNGKGGANYAALLAGFFGDTMGLESDEDLLDVKNPKWYFKDGEERKVDPRKNAYKNYGPAVKLSRIRTMDYTVWKEDIDGYLLENKPLSYISDDLKNMTLVQ